MKIFKSKHKLKKEILNIKNISFVPTMGGLHKGHVSLIKKAKTLGSKILVSIYINPKQFNKQRDFINYPRNIKKDLKILKKLNVNYIYLPKYKDIYSFQPTNKVFIDEFSNQLCGKNRKGHFKGVLNVVNRLLEIIKPKFMFLGIKDFQQLYLINAHIKKKKIDTKIIPCLTIREKNGVACSTRNNTLNKIQLQLASKVYRYLKAKKNLLNISLKNLNYINFNEDLNNLGIKKIDYIELLNVETLKKPIKKRENFKIFVAYYIKNTRLIDNI